MDPLGGLINFNACVYFRWCALPNVVILAWAIRAGLPNHGQPFKDLQMFQAGLPGIGI